MRAVAFGVGLSALLWSAAAQALVVETWTRRSLQFTNLGRAEVSATATGLATLATSSSASAHLSTLTLPLNPGLAVTETVPVTDPGAAPFTAVAPAFLSRPDLQGGGVIGNISGAIAGPLAALTPNTIPLTGMLVGCFDVPPLMTCEAQFLLTLGRTQTGMLFGHGVGGILQVGGSGTINISLIGAPYTVGTVSLPNRTANENIVVFSARGFAHGPVSLTSSTALSSGVLQMVTANKLTAIGYGDFLSGQISTLTVHVVPEPGWLLLFGAGAGGMLLLGRTLPRRR